MTLACSPVEFCSCLLWPCFIACCWKVPSVSMLCPCAGCWVFFRALLMQKSLPSPRFFSPKYYIPSCILACVICYCSILLRSVVLTTEKICFDINHMNSRGQQSVCLVGFPISFFLFFRTASCFSLFPGSVGGDFGDFSYFVIRAIPLL